MRTLADILLLIGVFIVPWWVVIVIACILLFIWDAYYEIVVFGFILDSLYNAPVPLLYEFQFVLTLFALCALLASTYLKSRMRLYR